MSEPTYRIDVKRTGPAEWTALAYTVSDGEYISGSATVRGEKIDALQSCQSRLSWVETPTESYFYTETGEVIPLPDLRVNQGLT